MTVRIGSVGYLNARPLTSRLVAEHEVVYGVPSAIAAELHAGRIHLGLVPVAEVLRGRDLRIVPGVCIGAYGPVTSVLLVAETPPEQWTEVVLDGESRTSAALTRVLLDGPLGARVGRVVPVVEGPPGTGVERARGTVASLVIGDAARVLPERLTTRVDLAAEWTAWTGLPFVFAVWAGRASLPASVVAAVRRAGEEGVAAIGDEYTGDDLAYLRDAIRFPLDEAALLGLRRFAALGHRLGLFPTPDVSLYGPPSRSLPRAADVDALLADAVDGRPLQPDEAERVLDSAPTADLVAAADLVRRARHPDGVVAWWLERRIGLDVAAAVEAGRHFAGVRLADEGAHIDAICSALPAIAAAVEVPVVGLGVRALEGANPVAAAARLRDAGLGVLAADQLRVGTVPWPLVAAALEAGLPVEAGVLLGDGESTSERVAHLLALRSLAERFPNGFVHFVARTLPIVDYGSRRRGNTGADHLRVTALARLLLNVHSVSASWATEGKDLAQASLHAGCDALGAVPVSGDPATWVATAAEAIHFVREAGFTPARRPDVDLPMRVGKKIRQPEPRA